MTDIQYTNYLVKESKTIHISTQTTTSQNLNGSMKSKVSYDVRGYLNFEDDASIEYITLEMPYAVMCNSNYIVNQYNNTLVVLYNSVLSTYTLTQGNYNSTTFIAHLQTFLTTGNGWSITLNTTNNKFSFSNTLASFTLKAETTCDYIIGFSGDTSSSLTSLYTLTCPRSCNFLPIPRFLLHCNLLNDGIMLGTLGTQSSSDILASIPNVSKNNAQIIYENNNSEFMIKAQNIGNIILTITDDNNREIDFQGISSYFVLKFNIFRYAIKKPMKFDQLVDTINRVPISFLGESTLEE